MGIKATTKAFFVYQSQKILFPSGRIEIPRLYCLSSRYPNKKRVN